MRDLLIVNYWNEKINDRLPVTYNNLLHGGYFNMPSARMGRSGEIGFGYSWVHPYINWNLRCQMTDCLEVSGDYRIFKGVADPILTPMGFGDLSDKGANIKLSLSQAEDSDYDLPGVAIGIEDFLGTKTFLSQYVVLTKVFIEHDCEVSIGYGRKRIKRWFGGINWIPFRRSGYCFLEGFSIAAEYDAIRYKNPNWETHPDGRDLKTRINFGIKYRLWDQFDCSLSYIRGSHLAFAISTYYNFGDCDGMLPKIDDPLPYIAPVNNQIVGPLRPPDSLMQDLIYAFREQGFDITEIWLSIQDCSRKVLWIRLENERYRCTNEKRDRFNHLMAYLIPDNIEEVTLVLENEGFPIDQYWYRMEFVRAYANQEIGLPELNLLTIVGEVSYPDPCDSVRLFKQNKEWFNFELLPKTHTFFGSAKGKFKFALGLSANFSGYLFNDVFYASSIGYIFWHNLYDLRGVDRLNPSQLVNVRTDIVEYYKQDGFTIDELFIQKNWNMGKGWFSRFSVGYFEQEYGGVAGEILYYPSGSRLALGVEGAWLRKREYPKGLKFTNKARKLHGFEVSWVKFYPWQYSFDLYYNWTEACLDFKVMAGKFLANDLGVRCEVSRYFPSGMRVTLWYTHTNGNDHINGHTYYDKGIAFSMPLDIFYTHSARSKWGYGMSAWLRDVGQFADTGIPLYPVIYNERR
jgi:hypothetical protein